MAVIGALVGAAFGRVWLSWAGDGIPGAQQALDLAGWLVVGGFLVAGAGVLVSVLRAPEPAGGTETAPPRPHPGWFGLVIAVEVALIAVGNRLLHTSLDAPELSPVWTLLVVGAHFVPFGMLLRIRAFHVLAAAMCAVAVAGALAGLLGSPALWYVVPGFGGAAARCASPAWALLRGARGRRTHDAPREAGAGRWPPPGRPTAWSCRGPSPGCASATPSAPAMAATGSRSAPTSIRCRAGRARASRSGW